MYASNQLAYGFNDPRLAANNTEFECTVCGERADYECKTCGEWACGEHQKDAGPDSVNADTYLCDTCGAIEMLYRAKTELNDMLERAYEHVLTGDHLTRREFDLFETMILDRIEYGIWTWEKAAA